MADEHLEELFLGPNSGILRETTRLCRRLPHVLLLHHLVCCLDELSKPIS